MSQRYLQRVLDHRLEEALERSGALLIEGPKGCGKSETARQSAGSFVQVDIDPQLRVQLEVAPQMALVGKTPRVFDEWQVAPRPLESSEA